MITPINTLKSWFKRGLKPLESQFHSWIDSFWHKSEVIPTINIEGLNDTLNNKAERKAFNDHVNDSSLHKTENEQSKLDNLADNPNDTYVRKDEASIPFVVNIEKDIITGSYSFPESEKTRIYQYYKDVGDFSDMQLRCKYIDINGTMQYEYYQNMGQTGSSSTSSSSGNLTVNFARLVRAITSTRIRVDSMYFTLIITSNGGMVINRPIYQSGTVENGYDPKKYFLEDDFNMDDLKESGGLEGYVEEDMVAQNIPAGVTEFYGYILASSYGVTQVLTDVNTQKTYLRMGYKAGRQYSYTPWKDFEQNSPSIVIEVDLNTKVVTNPESLQKFVDNYNNRPQVFIKAQDMYYRVILESFQNNTFYIECRQIIVGAWNGSDVLPNETFNVSASKTNNIVIIGTTNASGNVISNFVIYNRFIVNTADYLKVSNIHVVSSYPEDLSSYPEGSIFILE